MKTLDAHLLYPSIPPGVPALIAHERPPDGPTRTVCAAGDVGFSGHLAAIGAASLGEVADALSAADLAFTNLETTFLDEVEGVLFASPPAAAFWLAEAGFRLVHLANNHAIDHGAGVLARTLRTLGEAGIGVLGAATSSAEARDLRIFDLEGLRLGWLGAGRTHLTQRDGAEASFWEYDARELQEAVREARNDVDVLVVSLHMGYMYVDYPHPRQRREALALLEAGADAVLLHHAHVVQGIEATADGVVCYNLGNLLVDYSEGVNVLERTFEAQRMGALFFLEIDRRGVCRLTVVPTRLDDAWVVRWVRGEEGRTALERLRRISGGWNGEAAKLYHRQMAERVAGHTLRTTLAQVRGGGMRTLLSLLPRLRPRHLRLFLDWLALRPRRRE